MLCAVAVDRDWGQSRFAGDGITASPTGGEFTVFFASDTAFR